MTIEQTWDYIIERDIATEDELKLITYINGYNETSLNDVIYARTGMQDIEQLIGDDEDEDN